MFYSLYITSGKIDILMIINGILGALVGRCQNICRPIPPIFLCYIKLKTLYIDTHFHLLGLEFEMSYDVYNIFAIKIASMA